MIIRQSQFSSERTAITRKFGNFLASSPKFCVKRTGPMQLCASRKVLLEQTGGITVPRSPSVVCMRKEEMSTLPMRHCIAQVGWMYTIPKHCGLWFRCDCARIDWMRRSKSSVVPLHANRISPVSTFCFQTFSKKWVVLAKRARRSPKHRGFVLWLKARQQRTETWIRAGLPGALIHWQLRFARRCIAVRIYRDKDVDLAWLKGKTC